MNGTWVIDQGDIGACDDCGSEAEPRRLVLVDTTVQGAQVRLYVYVCPPCETQRKAS